MGRYVREQVHTNGLESFWAAMRRGYDGPFHRVSEDHLHRYVNGFAGRHSVRGMDTIGMASATAEDMAGLGLTYDGLTAHGMAR